MHCAHCAHCTSQINNMVQRNMLRLTEQTKQKQQVGNKTDNILAWQTILIKCYKYFFFTLYRAQCIFVFGHDCCWTDRYAEYAYIEFWLFFFLLMNFFRIVQRRVCKFKSRILHCCVNEDKSTIICESFHVSDNHKNTTEVWKYFIEILRNVILVLYFAIVFLSSFFHLCNQFFSEKNTTETHWKQQKL